MARSLTIPRAEDDPDDIVFLRRAFEKCGSNQQASLIGRGFAGSVTSCLSQLRDYSFLVKGKWHKSLPYLFMLIAALSRWPGLFPPNFSVFYALSFCAGAFFPGLMAWWLPLGTMAVTDIVLNVFFYHQPVVSWYMLIKAASFAGLILFGRLFSSRTSWSRLLLGGLFGAVLYYVITNTASWLYNPDYPKTLAGWIQALT